MLENRYAAEHLILFWQRPSGALTLACGHDDDGYCCCVNPVFLRLTALRFGEQVEVAGHLAPCKTT